MHMRCFASGGGTGAIFFFFQAEDGIRDVAVTGVQTCALPILGRAEAARGALPAHRQLQRALALGNARGGANGKSDRDGTDRTAPPSNSGSYSERDGAARRGVLDVARSGTALRDCVGQRRADADHGDRELDVEDEEDPHARRGTFENPAFYALLSAAEGCGAISGGVR